jgi:hypothetical protein
VGLRNFFQRLRERRRERVAEQMGNLSDAEREKLERLREEHDPLSEVARSGVPPQFRDSDRF